MTTSRKRNGHGRGATLMDLRLTPVLKEPRERHRFHQGEKINDKPLKALMGAVITLNHSKSKSYSGRCSSDQCGEVVTEGAK